MKTPAGNYFTWLFKQMHSPTQHHEPLGFAIFFKVLSAIPLCNQTEDLFILHAMKKIAPQASLCSPDGIEQRGNRLKQFLAFLGRNLHLHNDQDHNKG